MAPVPSLWGQLKAQQRDERPDGISSLSLEKKELERAARTRPTASELPGTEAALGVHHRQGSPTRHASGSSAGMAPSATWPWQSELADAGHDAFPGIELTHAPPPSSFDTTSTGGHNTFSQSRTRILDAVKSGPALASPSAGRMHTREELMEVGSFVGTLGRRFSSPSAEEEVLQALPVVPRSPVGSSRREAAAGILPSANPMLHDGTQAPADKENSHNTSPESARTNQPELPSDTAVQQVASSYDVTVTDSNSQSQLSQPPALQKMTDGQSGLTDLDWLPAGECTPVFIGLSP